MLNRVLLRVFALLLAILVSFLILEIAARALHGQYEVKSFWQEAYGGPRIVEYSPELGWQPSPGTYWVPRWKAQVNILENGIRSNRSDDQDQVPDTPYALAVGDSFTFGDQVSDSETWPAYLEQMSGIRVLNAGVTGYGLDQIVLRAEQLAPIYMPDVLIIAFIPDDLARTQLSRRGLFKPYFDLTDDKLTLRRDHLKPLPPLSRSAELLRETLGYSYLVHSLMNTFLRDFWSQGRSRQVQVHADSIPIACALFDQVTMLADSLGIDRVIILVQMTSGITQEELAMLEPVLACVDRTKISIVDLRKPLHDLWTVNPDVYRTLFDGHMTAKGNAFVASYLLESGPLLPAAK